MIGSRRKVKIIFDSLMEKGVPEFKLSQVHSPIGMDIGAQPPPEIAVSIVAELISFIRKSDLPDFSNNAQPQ
jgi:xanthine dehydrogenase accessory factor